MSATLAIKIITDAKQAAAGMDATTTKASKMGKAGAAAGKVLAVGAAAGAVALVKMGKAAAEDAQGAALMANALKTSAGATDKQVASTEKWITSQGKALGVTDDELRPAISRLARATGDVGKAQKLASLGMDIAAGSGKSLSTVTEALAKAQNGNLGGLSRLGVATKTATGETKTLAQVQKDLAAKYGGAAKAAAQTDAGKAKIAAVQFSELGEKIGAKLLPAMSKAAEFGIKMADWIDRNTTLAGILVGAVGGLLVAIKATSVVMANWSAITKIWSGVTKVAAGVQWLLNAALAANPITLVVIALVALVAAIVIAWKKSETFRRIVIGAWNAIKKATSAVWGAIKGTIQAVWRFIVAYVKTYVHVVLTVVKAVWNAIKKATSAVWNAIKGVVSAVWRGIKVVVVTYINTVRKVMGTAWDTIKGAVSRVWETIKTTVRNGISHVVDFVRGLKSKVTGFFSNAGKWLWNAGTNIIQGLIDGIRNMVGKVKDELGKVTGLIPDWKGPASRDKRLLYGAGRSIIGGLVSGFRSQYSGLRRELASVTSLVEAGVNPRVAVRPRSATLALVGASGGATALAPTVVENHYWTVQAAPYNEDATAAKIDDMLDKYRRRRGRR